MLTCVLLFVNFRILWEHISLVYDRLLCSPSPHRDPRCCPLPTFPNIPVSRALELSGAQQEAGPVVRIAFPAGCGAEASCSRATFVPEDLIDGGAVLIGQGRSVGCRVTVLLGVCKTGLEGGVGWGWGFVGVRGGLQRRRKGRKDGWSLERRRRRS